MHAVLGNALPGSLRVIVQVKCRDRHGVAELDPHIKKLLLKVQAARRVLRRVVLTHDANAHGIFRLIRWQRIERIHRAAEPVLDIAVRLRGVHGREELLANPSERPGLGLEAGICKVPVAEGIDVLDHAVGSEQILDAMRNREIGVHHLLAIRHVIPDLAGGHIGKVEHLEMLVPRIAQDHLLQLAIVVKTAEARDLHERVGTLLERCCIVADDVLERRADVIRAHLLPALDRGARGRRHGNEICIEHLLGEVFERWLVVAEMEEGDLMARMPAALGALAGEKERAGRAVAHNDAAVLFGRILNLGLASALLRLGLEATHGGILPSSDTPRCR